MRITIDIKEQEDGVLKTIIIEKEGLNTATEWELRRAVALLAGIDLMDEHLRNMDIAPGLGPFLFENYALVFTRYLQAGGIAEIAKTLCPESLSEEQKDFAVEYLLRLQKQKQEEQEKQDGA